MITRRDLLVACVTLGLAAALAAVAQSAAKPPLGSRVFQWGTLKVEPTKTGELRRLFDAPTLTLDRIECHATSLNVGEAPHPAHRHPEDELIIVKEGALESVQNGQTNRVEAGGMIFESSNDLHGIRNAADTRTTYYVLKWFPAGLPKAKSQ